MLHNVFEIYTLTTTSFAFLVRIMFAALLVSSTGNWNWCRLCRNAYWKGFNRLGYRSLLFRAHFITDTIRALVNTLAARCDNKHMYNKLYFDDLLMLTLIYYICKQMSNELRPCKGYCTLYSLDNLVVNFC